MIRRIAASVSVTLCILSTITFAAGFDCSKASTAVEKLICSDKELSKADQELSDVYSRALASSAKPGDFKKEQINWLRTQRDACRYQECLAAVYKNRIDVLSAPEPMEEYYLREPFPTGVGSSNEEESDDNKHDGPYYHVCVKVHGNPLAPLIDFEVYFPDSGQSVTAEFVRCKNAKSGVLEFAFTDNWGNKGKGTLDRGEEEATLDLEEVQAVEESGLNRMAVRNYGRYELTKQKCRSGEGS